MRKDLSKNYAKNTKSIIAIFLVFAIFLIGGVSYALWQVTLRQSGENTVTTDCFKIEFSDENSISLGDTLPIRDEDGKKLAPYEFTLTNTCNSNARYQVNLEVLDTTTLENHSYIKTMYNENNPLVLTEYEKTEKTLDDAVDSYILDVGYLSQNENRTFNLRLWMDEDTPAVDEAMNKTFSSKITVTTSYAKKIPGTLRTVSSSETNGMWEYKNNITKLVIQNKLNKIDGAVKVSDESVTKDESIMSYVVLNEDGETYTAYLQGQDVIYLNSDSSFLLAGFQNLKIIEGCRYLDTSNVSNMANMFYSCENLINVDVSNFNTSNVTNMSAMFDKCNSLTILDLSNFDTSQVVLMSSMFQDCEGLTTLDLDNFDTKKVTSMQFMFSRCRNLINLSINNFDTSNVTHMRSMFVGCIKLTSLDISSFNTRNVIDMHDMFDYCSNLTNITYGDNFIHKDTADTKNMFNNCPANKPTDSSWDGVTF